MRERFDDTFYEEVNSFMGTAFGDSELDAKLKDFIEQELKLKDQEHKAELERIKGEVDNIDFSEDYRDDYLKDSVKAILDSHINKL